MSESVDSTRPFVDYIFRNQIYVGGPLHGTIVNRDALDGYRPRFFEEFPALVWLFAPLSSEAAELLLGVLEQEFNESAKT